MSVTSDYLHKVIEDLPDNVRAEIIEGEIILNAATPFIRHTFVVRALRRAIGEVTGLVELDMVTVVLPATEDEFIPDLTYYSFEDLTPDMARAFQCPGDGCRSAIRKDDSAGAKRDRKY